MLDPQSPPRGVLLDLDGTLYQDGQPIAGAAGAVRALRAEGMPVRFVTNTTRQPRRAVLETLAAAGVDASADELITAPVAAVARLRERGLARVAPLLAEATLEDLAAVGIDEREPEVVLAGDLGTGWTFDVLNRAFRWLMAGAELMAIQKNRYWRTGGELTLDAGPFVSALEYASGKPAEVVGKPSRAFFAAAARSMDLAPRDVVMVGDDLDNDVAGAQRCGARGVLVRTGKFRPADLAASDVEPDAIIASVADLPGVLLD